MPYGGLDLSWRVAVVVGGTSGIGMAIALGLAEAGADVVATGRRAQQAEEAAERIKGLGRRTISITADVRDRASLERLLSAMVDAFVGEAASFITRSVVIVDGSFLASGVNQ